jgi:L,D-transpeptidase ErfK/SrfK
MKTKLCGKAHLLNAVVYLMGLRILSDTTVLYEFPVRVGQNKSKYLKMGDRMTNFRIKCGESQIIRHERNPDFYNPENGHRFYVTKRDDERITMMPQINGIRNGQMIHPTTNPKTLRMAYSHGCIG